MTDLLENREGWAMRRSAAALRPSGLSRCASQAKPAAAIADPFTDPTKDGIFRDHRCWKCRSGEFPCATQKPGREYLCEYPHARND